jgi:hypothetical protein
MEGAVKLDFRSSAANGRTLFLSGGLEGDEFLATNEGAWNVTKARCLAWGGHAGPRFPVAVTRVYDALVNCEVDKKKVRDLVRHKDSIADWPPLIHIERGLTPAGDAIIYLIDGLHRVHALMKLGVPKFDTFVIPIEFEPRLRMHLYRDDGVELNMNTMQPLVRA